MVKLCHGNDITPPLVLSLLMCVIWNINEVVLNKVEVQTKMIVNKQNEFIQLNVSKCKTKPARVFQKHAN